MRKTLVAITALVLAAASQRGEAVTECAGHVVSYFAETGTGGGVWVVMPNGLQWYVLYSSAETRTLVAQLTTAIATNLTVQVRFQADGLACDSTAGARTDVVGLWLNSF